MSSSKNELCTGFRYQKLIITLSPKYVTPLCEASKEIYTFCYFPIIDQNRHQSSLNVLPKPRGPPRRAQSKQSRIKFTYWKGGRL